MDKEEIEQIAKSSAQAVLEGLHRYAVDYKEPESVEQGLQDSMVEERTAADWYRKRAKNAADYHVDAETMALYQDMAVDEDEHYVRLNARLQKLTKELEEFELSKRSKGPDESGSLYSPPDPRAKKCDYPGCTKWAQYYGKEKGATRYLCVPHFKEVYKVPDW